MPKTLQKTCKNQVAKGNKSSFNSLMLKELRLSLDQGFPTDNYIDYFQRMVNTRISNRRLKHEDREDLFSIMTYEFLRKWNKPAKYIDGVSRTRCRLVSFWNKVIEDRLKNYDRDYFRSERRNGLGFLDDLNHVLDSRSFRQMSGYVQGAD